MSPVVLRESGFIFWFHSYDALYENRASVHVGQSSPDDYTDAKVWLEPVIEVAREGRSLKRHELMRLSKSSRRTTSVCWKGGANMEARQSKERIDTKWYKIEYKASEYTFPSDDPRIDDVWFDDEYMHVALEDERRLSIPLKWIPSLYNAPPEERQKYQISPSRTMIFWDPDKGAINDEVRIRDYLVGLPNRAQAEHDTN